VPRTATQKIYGSGGIIGTASGTTPTAAD